MKTEINPDLSNTQTAFSNVSDSQLIERYKWFRRMCKPFLLKLAEFFVPLIRIFPQWTYRKMAKKTIYKFFVGGETLEECMNKIETLNRSGIGVIPDLSVESASSQKAIEKALREIERTIDLSNRFPEKIPFTVFKISGLIEKGDLETINQKIRKAEKLNPVEEKALKLLQQRVMRLCSAAQTKNVRILIDAEETWVQDAIHFIAVSMMVKYNKEHVTVINTYQAYRKDACSLMQHHIEILKANGCKLGVKLVRGAYMEKERERALEAGYASPIHDSKTGTDHEYHQGLVFCLDRLNDVLVVIATHSQESIQFALKMLEEKKIPANSDHVHFSQLYGMGDVLSYNLAKANCNVCKYLPFGPVKDVIPYLTRRARENSSVNGFASQELRIIATEMLRRNLLFN
jgi:proline dehydrogenase